jgi:hypothetical protein
MMRAIVRWVIELLLSIGYSTEAYCSLFTLCCPSRTPLLMFLPRLNGCVSYAGLSSNRHRAPRLVLMPMVTVATFGSRHPQTAVCYDDA